MARVKMNSRIKAHPAITGPAVKSIIGLAIKKIKTSFLYQSGDAPKKFDVNATPTLIINDKKFDKPLDYKNLKKTLEKLI